MEREKFPQSPKGPDHTDAGGRLTPEALEKLDHDLNEIRRRAQAGSLRMEPLMGLLGQVIDRDSTNIDILKQATATDLEAVDTFIAGEKFKLNAMIGDYPISWFGNKFLQHFGSVVEEQVPAHTMNSWDLLQVRRDSAIVSVLGGEEKAESHLAHLYRIMELGDKGPALTNGWGNIGFARSPIDNKLYTVRWHVLGGGLYIGSRSDSVPGEWGDGPRVHGG